MWPTYRATIFYELFQTKQISRTLETHAKPLDKNQPIRLIGCFALPVMVEQLIAMEEYEVTLYTEKIASKFSPTGRAPTY